MAGCNPGAMIDEVVKHSADEDYDGGEAYIYNESGLSLKHGIVQTEMEDNSMAEKGKTLEEIYKSMTPEQQKACNAFVGLALNEGADDEYDDEYDEYDEDYDEEDDDVKHNVFDDDSRGEYLAHGMDMDEIDAVIKNAKSAGSLRAAFDDAGIGPDELAHSIDNVDWCSRRTTCWT